MQDYFEHLFEKIDPNIKLDIEQQKAILCDDQNVMIIAGAGAGKTTTMAAKVKYLVEQKGIKPEEIVLLSYTNKAVEELKTRINHDFEIPVEVYTFHKLGIQILEKLGRKKTVLSDSSNILRKIISEKLEQSEKLRYLVLKYFSKYSNLSNFDLKIKSKKEYQTYKTKLEYLSLLGHIQSSIKETMKEKEEEKTSLLQEVFSTYEEVTFANTLFYYGIPYEIGKKYPYGKNYIPQFIIYQEDTPYYVELINPTFCTPFEKLIYERKIRTIRKLHEKNHTTLIEIKVTDDFVSEIENTLEDYGFQKKEKTKREIFFIISHLKQTRIYEDFVNLCMDFIRSFKLRGYGIETFEKWNDFDNRTTLFLTLVKEIYTSYQNYLKENELYDFEDMIKDALEGLKEGTISLSYKYLIVDEYQDISMERFYFLQELLKVSGAHFLVVGDDWQSIYSFAGSELSLFTEFEKYCGKVTKLKITHTYRNSQELITSAGNFIMKNPFQFQKELISPKHLTPSIYVVLYEERKDKAKALQKCVEKIVEDYGECVEILLLGRFKFDLFTVLHKSYFLLEENSIKSVRFPQVKFTFLTVHAAKGLGFPHVILLNGEEGEYGFPAMKRSDPVLELVNTYDKSFEYAEERRLFYVALTRTKNTVFLLSPIHETSPFIRELEGTKVINLSKKKWRNKKLTCPRCHYPLVRNYWNQKGIEPLYECVNHKRVCGFETNNLEYKKRIKKCPDCKSGYLIVKHSKYGDFIGCTNLKNGCTYKERI